MAFEFASEEWAKAAMEEVNKSQAYREAAKDWEGDFYFVIEPEGKFRKRIILYFDLWHGTCRSVSLIADEKEKTPEFRISAPLSNWRKVLEGKVDPVRALITRSLKLEGSLLKIMKHTKAAVEFVNSCARVETEFPEV